MARLMMIGIRIHTVFFLSNLKRATLPGGFFFTWITLLWILLDRQISLEDPLVMTPVVVITGV